MAELLLLLFVLCATAVAVAWPLLDRLPTHAASETGDEHEAALVRHRLALETLRDLEADRRAGSLDQASYARQRAEAEQYAVHTLNDAERDDASPRPAPPATGARRLGLVLGGGLAALLLVAFALPAPVGIAERTSNDQALADAIAAEEARQAQIAASLQRLDADRSDTAALSALADAYLAGPTASDQQRGAVALLALIGLEPDNASAYRRLITAYINAGDWTDARAAVEAFADVTGEDDADIPFFRGLIALRGDGDQEEAVLQFDRFLELAPHDPRAGMVLSLREQAAQAEGGS